MTLSSKFANNIFSIHIRVRACDRGRVNERVTKEEGTDDGRTKELFKLGKTTAIKMKGLLKSKIQRDDQLF